MEIRSGFLSVMIFCLVLGVSGCVHAQKNPETPGNNQGTDRGNDTDRTDGENHENGSRKENVTQVEYSQGTEFRYSFSLKRNGSRENVPLRLTVEEKTDDYWRFRSVFGSNKSVSEFLIYSRNLSISPDSSYPYVSKLIPFHISITRGFIESAKFEKLMTNGGNMKLSSSGPTLERSSKFSYEGRDAYNLTIDYSGSKDKDQTYIVSSRKPYLLLSSSSQDLKVELSEVVVGN